MAKEMPQHLRLKLLRILNGEPRNTHFLYFLYTLENCEEVLNWLTLKAYTGIELQKWIEKDFRGEPLAAFAWLRSRFPVRRKNSLEL